MHATPDDDQILKIMARRVRDLRHARGLTQQQIADDLDMHRAYFGGIERGHRNITLRSLARLARGLEVTPQSLLAEDDPPTTDR